MNDNNYQTLDYEAGRGQELVHQSEARRLNPSQHRQPHRNLSLHLDLLYHEHRHLQTFHHRQNARTRLDHQVRQCNPLTQWKHWYAQRHVSHLRRHPQTARLPSRSSHLPNHHLMTTSQERDLASSGQKVCQRLIHFILTIRVIDNG